MTLQRLNDAQLQEAADQLELPLESVKQLYEAAVAGGVQGLSSTKEFIALVEKEAKKVAADTSAAAKKAAAEGETEEEDMLEAETAKGAKVTKEELQAVLTTLSEDERKELREALDQTDELAATGNLALHKEIAVLKEAVTATNAQLNALIAAMNTAVQKQQTTEAEPASAVQDALRQILGSQPRSTFASKRKEAGGESDAVNDTQIAKQLAEIQAKLKEIAPPTGRQFHSLFTSENLNAHRQR